MTEEADQAFRHGHLADTALLVRPAQVSVNE